MVDKKEIEKVEAKIASKPSWVKMKPAEVEKIVVGLAEQGESPAKIGLILRDKYGIPKAKLLGKKISVILREKGIEFMSKKRVFSDNIERLKKHIVRNKHDYPATRAVTKKLWVVHKLEIGKAS